MEEMPTSIARITQTKKAKMKARAISVDSDDPDADNTDQVINSGETINATNDLYRELDEVPHLFFTPIDHFRCLVDGAKHIYSRCKSSICVPVCR